MRKELVTDKLSLGAQVLRRLMFLALVAICTSGAFAQKQVSGTVVDAAGEPIIEGNFYRYGYRFQW